MAVCQSADLSVCRSVGLSVCQSVGLSVCRFVGRSCKKKWKRFTKDAFQAQLSESLLNGGEWSHLSPDEMVTLYHDVLVDLFDRHAPQCRVSKSCISADRACVCQASSVLEFVIFYDLNGLSFFQMLSKFGLSDIERIANMLRVQHNKMSSYSPIRCDLNHSVKCF